MLVLRNIITLGCSAFTALALFACASGSRVAFLPALALALAASVFASWYVTMGEASKFERVMLGAPNVLAVFGVVSLALFVETPWIRAGIIIAVSLLQAAYLTHLFFFLHVPTRYSPQALESVASFMHMMTVFSISVAMFGTILFVEIPLVVLLIPFALIVGAVMFQSLWIAKVPIPRARTLSIVGATLLAEIALAFSFLPTSLYVNAAALALIAYAMHFVFRVSPLDPYFLRTARRTVLLASGLFVILFATAPWR
jgi:hypothetical protein